MTGLRAIALLTLAAASVACPRAGLAAGGQLLTMEVTWTNTKPQRPTAAVNTLQDFMQALFGCWAFPEVDAGREPVDAIFELSFKRSGELFGKPRVIKFSRDVSPEERGRFYVAVAEAIDRCSPMPFTESMGHASAGRVFRIRLIDSRKRKQTGITWPTEKS